MKKLYVIAIFCSMLLISGCSSNDNNGSSENSKTQYDSNSKEQSTTQEFNGSSEGGNGNPNVQVTNEVEEKDLSPQFEKEAQEVMDKAPIFRGYVDAFNNPQKEAIQDSSAASMGLTLKNVPEDIDMITTETDGDRKAQDQLLQMVNYYNEATKNFEMYLETMDQSYLDKGNDLVNKGYTIEVEIKRGTNLI